MCTLVIFRSPAGEHEIYGVCDEHDYAILIQSNTYYMIAARDPCDTHEYA